MASQDVYWSEEPHTLAQGLFSDWAYDNANFGTGSLQITLSANPGYALTNVSFSAFCARASGCASESYSFYSVVGNTWTLLSSGTLAAFTSTDVTNGTLFTVATAVSEAAKIVFQIGSDGYVGIDNVKYDVSPIPLPGAMVLLGSALAGVAGIGYRRRKDQAAA
ncbi:PEP-CTERM sorting domain-containing protein [Aestuariivirga sp.]|uniref:PEP-CTERM sorting domain-containing protein n=1 Tax=Aestuariivirga sp. TaxID=2650926 RepID=UPI0039E4027B